MTALWKLGSENFSVARKLTPVSTRYWSNPGAWFHDVVTRKLTVVLFQPMPGLEEPGRK
jgi:hypothetical protein